ncbi:MAG TPA: type IV pilin [Methanocorpusculum sp.]|nr:type IV pilin [Methanocorpusculum sp.]HJK80937.1 type IV pilin [Methanocorpusculum sp.]
MKSVAKKDDAVSPVIGTILLVAITVVLVAIVAAVVMGMVGNMSETKNVGVVVDPFSNDTHQGVIVTLSSGADANKIDALYAYLDGKAFGVPTNSKVSKPGVGVPYAFSNESNDQTSVSGTVTVSATFQDNTTQVIYTGKVTLPAKTTASKKEEGEDKE